MFGPRRQLRASGNAVVTNKARRRSLYGCRRRSVQPLRENAQLSRATHIDSESGVLTVPCFHVREGRWDFQLVHRKGHQEQFLRLSELHEIRFSPYGRSQIA